MMTQLTAMEALIQAAEGWIDPTPLHRGRALLRRPWTVAVIGRVGVGKSSLINAALGEPARPTGLGGITDREARIPLGREVILIDTPGIDGEAPALTRLTPLLEQVDALIWVIDGLQPLTASERRVVQLTRPEDLPLHIVLSRRDLVDEDEARAIFKRAEVLTQAHRPASLHHLDLRRPPAPLPEALFTPLHPGPRRRHALRDILIEARQAIEATPPAPSRQALLQDLRDRWAATVREAQGRVPLRPGSADTAPLALLHLYQVAPDARRAFLEGLDDLDLPLPEMPLPDPPESSPLQQVFGSFSGLMGARRALQSEAARWLAEGEVQLLEWSAHHEALDDRHAARAALEQAWRHAWDTLADDTLHAAPTRD